MFSSLNTKLIGKLMIDANGNAFLYNSIKNEFKEITLYPPEKFRPEFFYDSTSAYDYGFRRRSLPPDSPDLSDHYNNGEKKAKIIKSPFDNVRIYSIQVRENNDETKPLLRYGFIDENGYAITHATYDKVETFIHGRAKVCLDGQCCSIDLQGYPILNGYCFMDAEFVFKEEQNFIKCCTDGKYGLINKYGYLCIPCEYDSIILKKERSEDCFYAELKKGNIDYTAIIEGDSICNIISSFKPNFIKLYENFLIIEEQTTKDGKVFSKQGLLNRGGIRILKSEYDSIDIVSKCFITAQEKKYHSSIYDSIANVSSIFAIVSKDDIKQLLFITETDFTVIIDYSEEIVYGEGVNEYDGMKYYYASINNNTIRIFMSLKQQGGFCAFKDECIRSYECDKIYFSYNGIPNNYFAVVESDKTKLINRYFDEIIPPVIPSKYLVKTDSYSEGIVAIYIMKQEKNGLGNTIEKPYYSFINSQGKVFSDFVYNEVEKFKNGQAWAYFDGGEHLFDSNGNIIQTKTYRPNYDTTGSSWRDLIDDAFEGDSGAYWNID